MLTSREARELRALLTRRGCAAHGRFLAEGIRVVEDLLGSGLQPRWALLSSTLEDNPRGRELQLELDRRGITARVVPERDFATFSATEVPQGIIVVADLPDTRADDPPDPEELQLILVLDAIQDPGNLGTLVRSAEALGAARVLVLPGTVDPWNPKVVRSAAGSLFRLPILELDRSEAVQRLREWGYSIVGAEGGGRTPSEIREMCGARLALILGNEGAGLSLELREAADALVGIPLRGRADSLNVAAAAAILLYEFTR